MERTGKNYVYHSKLINNILNESNQTWQEKKDCLVDYVDAQIVGAVIQVMNLMRTKKITSQTPITEIVRIIRGEKEHERTGMD